MYSNTQHFRSKSSTKSKDQSKFSKIKNSSKQSKNISSSRTEKSNNVLHNYYSDPSQNQERKMNMNEVSEKLKERKMKLEQELGNYLGIEFESDYSNQKKTGIVTLPNESRAFREFRQIRQSMATEGRKNNK